MSRRALVLLLAGLAVLALIAISLAVGNRTGGSDEALLLPGLAEELNDITRITVRTAGDRPIATLVRGEDTWTVQERSGYPADVGRIRKNLLALSGAKRIEEKTSNPEFYERLGVQDVSSDSARGVQLDLQIGTEAHSVIVGDTASGGDLTYVRLAGEPRSWLVSGRFDPGRDAVDWLEPQVLDIPAERIKSVTIRHPGGEVVRIEKPVRDSTDFIITGTPKDREPSPGAASSVAGALAGLTLENVQNRDSVQLGNAGQPVVARFTTFDGLVVEATVWPVPDGRRVTFSASTDPSDTSHGEATQEAEAINTRLAGWAYTLPGYKSDPLTRRLQDLLTPAAS